MTMLIQYSPTSGLRSFRKHRGHFFGHDHAIRRMIETPLASFTRSYKTIFDTLDTILETERSDFNSNFEYSESESVPASTLKRRGTATSSASGASGASGGELSHTRHRRRSRRPHADIHEDDSQWTVDIEVPGIGLNDVDVTLENETLQISGNLKTRRRGSGNNLKHSQAASGTSSVGDVPVTVEELQQFKYSYTLPRGIDKDNISASLANGILHITVPKAQVSDAPQKRSIAITTTTKFDSNATSGTAAIPQAKENENTSSSELRVATNTVARERENETSSGAGDNNINIGGPSSTSIDGPDSEM